MEKIKAAIERENPDIEKASDKWGLFRGLEVAPPLTQTMIDLLYAKDDVAEEMLDFVKEQSGDEFEYGLIDFTNTQEIACEYLDSVEHQVLQEKLLDRAQAEMDSFIRGMRHQIIAPDTAISDNRLIHMAYRLTIMNEILIYFEDEEAFDTDELKALLTVQDPLDYLYEIWADCDVNIKDNIVDVVHDSVRDLERSIEDKERGFLENEDEEDMEL